MDPISQGALGAIAAASFAPARDVRLVSFVGWIGGMLADADIAIRSDSDPLLNIEYHRHFSHALLFIPFGGLVCAAALWVFLRKRMGFGRLYSYSTLGYATAGLLDACTSYGTRLYWPFSDVRVAWNAISIIDPIFTGTILVLLWVGWRRRNSLFSVCACVFAVAYLFFGLVQYRNALQEVERIAEERGHAGADRFTAKPSFGNILVWRGMYEFDERIYVDAIRVPYFGGAARIYEGESLDRIDLRALLRRLPEGSALSGDLERFDHFSDSYLCWHPSRENVICDARYAVLPNSLDPLWGIEVDFDQPDRHAPFLTFRRSGKEQRATLWRMILGRD